ncbi:MAG: hypothetical protein HQK49_13775 [Oligoflexia bacterium]|nr:hypothetical protein [Oligoflexia bacterium]
MNYKNYFSISIFISLFLFQFFSISVFAEYNPSCLHGNGGVISTTIPNEIMEYHFGYGYQIVIKGQKKVYVTFPFQLPTVSKIKEVNFFFKKLDPKIHIGQIVLYAGPNPVHVITKDTDTGSVNELIQKKFSIDPEKFYFSNMALTIEIFTNTGSADEMHTFLFTQACMWVGNIRD